MKDASLVTLTDPRSPVAEAFRALRTNLEFSSLDRPLRSLLVTSAAPEEGKSTLLANLAVSIAQAEKQVILADCDLRRPAQHTLFGLKDSPGLTTMLRDGATLSDPPLQDTSVPGLKVLTSGPLPPNPPDVLSSQRMEQALAALLDRCDILLLDAPPIIAVTDAAILAARADAVLLVVNAGKTRREHAQRAKALLEHVNARLLGVVLNGVPLDDAVHLYHSHREAP